MMEYWLGLDCGGTFIKADYTTAGAMNTALRGAIWRSSRRSPAGPSAIWHRCGAPPPT